MLREPVPPGVRPTSSRVREALFAMIGHDLTGVRMLDAFGGSGLVAIEAWSRGAAVTVVEKDPAIARSLRRRAAEVEAQLIIRVGDVLESNEESFDGIFVDPPYAMGAQPAEVLAARAGSWLVLECTRDLREPPFIGELQLDRRKDYGGSSLVVYRRSA